MKHRRSALILGLLVFTACGPNQAELDAKVQKFLGKEAIDILQGATRVEVLRVDPQGNPANIGVGDFHQELDGHRIVKVAKPLDLAAAVVIVKLLFNPSTYVFDVAKECKPSPGVVFRLSKGQESVDTLICYECGMLKILVNDSHGKPNSTKYTDFDPAKVQFIELAKTAFPDDSEIQKLH